MEIKLKIDDIDYNSLADMMMPMLLEQMSSDRDDLVTRLMLLSQGFTESTVRTILSKMSKEKKDEMLVKMINRNKAKIIELLMDMALTKGIRLSITDVEAVS